MCRIERKNQQMLVADKQDFKDFKWALGLNRLTLRLMGVWPGDDELPGPRGLLILLRVPFMMTSMLLFLILPQMYALVLVIRELPLVIDNLITNCAGLNSCLKLFFLWRSKLVLRPVIQSVTRDWLRPKLTWEHEAMIREASRARVFTLSGYVVLAGCYSCFAFAPLLGLDIRLISNITDRGARHLLVQSAFPYDYFASPNYEATYAAQFVASFFLGMAVSIPDNYFAALVFHVSAQFEILGAKMANSAGREDSREFGGRMKLLVDRHVHLMAIVAAIESSFSSLMLTQVLGLSIIIGCLGFQIIRLFEASSRDQPSLFQMVTLIGTSLTVMMHTLVDCFACETLILRSSGIHDDIYNSRWYDLSKEKSLAVIPIMAASLKPRMLTAGKIFSLSLSAYCQILKSTAGYLSMLVAVHKQSSSQAY